MCIFNTFATQATEIVKEKACAEWVRHYNRNVISKLYKRISLDITFIQIKSTPIYKKHI